LKINFLIDTSEKAILIKDGFFRNFVISFFVVEDLFWVEISQNNSLSSIVKTV